jgi:hypothetical protein
MTTETPIRMTTHDMATKLADGWEGTLKALTQMKLFVPETVANSIDGAVEAGLDAVKNAREWLELFKP